jgi:hypothetical protein
MLRSLPRTVSLPLATAVVKGDNRGWNARMYGSSDVSVTRNVSSASRSGVIAMAPLPDTARRADEASSFTVIRLPSISDTVPLT